MGIGRVTRRGTTKSYCLKADSTDSVCAPVGRSVERRRVLFARRHGAYRQASSTIDEPEKNWKFSAADIVERKFWKQYMSAYERCLSATSTRDAPWYVVPADDKENARLIVSRIVLDTLEALKMTYPKTSAKRRRELRLIRRRLAK